MRLSRGGSPPSAPSDDGFTVIELMIATLIMTVVVAMAGTIIYSVTVAANRNGAVISNQQQASNVITQLGRDIRSANTLSFPTSAPATQVELIDNQVTSTGATTSTPVLWLYSTAAATCRSVTAPCLLRETQVSGTFTANPSFSISLSNNITTNPVFTYYTFANPGVAISSTQSPNYFSTCTTDMAIDLIMTTTTNNAPSTFEDTDQVALTNQVNTLTAPGNGNCR